MVFQTISKMDPFKNASIIIITDDIIDQYTRYKLHSASMTLEGYISYAI